MSLTESIQPQVVLQKGQHRKIHDQPERALVTMEWLAAEERLVLTGEVVCQVSSLLSSTAWYCTSVD
jgi:hypothetical protein